MLPSIAQPLPLLCVCICKYMEMLLSGAAAVMLVVSHEMECKI
jgi:hypothetical protein